MRGTEPVRMPARQGYSGGACGTGVGSAEFFFFFCLSKKRNKKKTARKETALSSHRFPIKLLNYCDDEQRGCDVVDWSVKG